MGLVAIQFMDYANETRRRYTRVLGILPTTQEGQESDRHSQSDQHDQGQTITKQDGR
jgi:hypothetical protein